MNRWAKFSLFLRDNERARISACSHRHAASAKVISDRSSTEDTLMRIKFLLVVSLLACATAVVAAEPASEGWPQWLGPKGDSIWRETGIVEKFPAGGPKILWRTPIGGGYAGPAVLNGKVYVMDRQLAAGVANPADPFQKGSIARHGTRACALRTKPRARFSGRTNTIASTRSAIRPARAPRR